MDDDTRAEFGGVFMVAGVTVGRSAVKEGPASDTDKHARATVYKVIHNWSKESVPVNVPSGQKRARDPTRRIRVTDSVLFNGKCYPPGSYPRIVLASELTRVPQDEWGLPTVEDQTFVAWKDRNKKKNKKYQIEKLSAGRRARQRTGLSISTNVKFKGFEPTEMMDYSVVRGTAALDVFFKENPPK